MNEQTPFCILIKKLRLDKDLALTDFCEKINVKAVTWSKIERNILPPPLPDDPVWLRISNVLNLCNDDIIDLVQTANYVREMLPRYKMTEQEAIAALPFHYRNPDGSKPTKEDVEKFIKFMMEENNG